jgi:hypothetical protein
VLLEEIAGPATGDAADADPGRTMPVRTKATALLVGNDAGQDEGDGRQVELPDTRLERGNSLVVLTRFHRPPAGERGPRRQPVARSNRHIPLVKSLADPVFGGSVPEVTTDLTYHIEYAGQRTRALDGVQGKISPG